jgi:OmpA-OmpF porin, OOP family
MRAAARAGRLALGGLLLLSLAGGFSCARKATSAAPGAPAGAPGSLHGSSTPPPPAEPRKWDYAALPSPTPAAPPLYLLSEFNFSSGGAALDREAHGVLSQAVAFLNQKRFAELLIIGFADAFGEKAVGDSLAIGRANAVRRSLTGSGVEAARLTVAGYGSRQAKAREDQPLAQALDRKVELWVVKE